jgi:hypothetical protein
MGMVNHLNSVQPYNSYGISTDSECEPVSPIVEMPFNTEEVITEGLKKYLDMCKFKVFSVDGELSPLGSTRYDIRAKMRGSNGATLCATLRCDEARVLPSDRGDLESVIKEIVEGLNQGVEITESFPEPRPSNTSYSTSYSASGYSMPLPGSGTSSVGIGSSRGLPTQDPTPDPAFDPYDGIDGDDSCSPYDNPPYDDLPYEDLGPIYTPLYNNTGPSVVGFGYPSLKEDGVIYIATPTTLTQIMNRDRK